VPRTYGINQSKISATLFRFKMSSAATIASSIRVQLKSTTIHHVLFDELINIRPRSSPTTTALMTTLYKTRQFEVLCMVLLVGNEWPGHAVAGAIR